MPDSIPRPAFHFIKVDERAIPPSPQSAARAAAPTYADSERMACAKCGGRADGFETFEPNYTGTLHSAVIVRRGYPGIPVPFISAIVDIDGGPTLKGRRPPPISTRASSRPGGA